MKPSSANIPLTEVKETQAGRVNGLKISPVEIRQRDNNYKGEGKPYLSGWYYDIQQDPKESPLTTVSLHPNKKYTGEGDTGWEVFDSTDRDFEGYSLDPICTSILSEDFNVQVSNQWSDFGGDPLSELWDRAKPLAPYANLLASAIKQIDSQIDKNSLQNDDSISGYLSRGVSWLAKNGPDKLSDFLNRKLIVQGTRFSYYSGTDISFGSLGMKFTIFPKWVNGTLLSVNNQVSQLYPYVIGKMVDEDFGVKDETMKETIKDYIKWQKPPGGYSPKPQNIDKIQEGTLKLKIGAFYSIPNLLVQDAQFTYSRQMVKLPTTSVTGYTDNEITENTSVISPLSCDVSLLFRPSTKFSDKALKEFVTGTGRNNDIEYLQNMMQAKLQNA